MFVFLHGINDLPNTKIFDLKTTGPMIYSKNDLQELNYPKVNGDLYLVYEFAKDVSNEFGNIAWDLTKLDDFESGKRFQEPLTISLTKLMKTRS